MLYIHGGAYQNGSSTTKAYAPDYILMADVVVVTINYRLGAFGFMSLNDEELNVPGNAGLKDQLMAMKFVKSNIHNFGGDPNNITLFGQSAGGASVSFHCASERSRGLFNRAIIMSGCILNSWSLTPRRDWANRLARKLGYEGSENEKDLLDFLQKADPVKIVDCQKSLVQRDEKIAFAFAPTIEPYTNENTFIPTDPIGMLQKAWSHDIDVLVGGVSDEGLMYYSELKANPGMLEHFKLSSVIPTEVGLAPDHPKAIEFVESLKQIYYPTSSDPTKDDLAFCKVRSSSSDSLFICIVINQNHFLLFLRSTDKNWPVFLAWSSEDRPRPRKLRWSRQDFRLSLRGWFAHTKSLSHPALGCWCQRRLSCWRDQLFVQEYVRRRARARFDGIQSNSTLRKILIATLIALISDSCLT